MTPHFVFGGRMCYRNCQWLGCRLEDQGSFPSRVTIYFSVTLLPLNWSWCSPTFMSHTYVLRGTLSGGRVIKATTTWSWGHSLMPKLGIRRTVPPFPHTSSLRVTW